MATMTPTSYSWTSPSWTCWSQSGSTVKYESGQGPSCGTSGFSITNGSGTSQYNYAVMISSSVVDGYSYTLPTDCTANSSGAYTYTWPVFPSITTNYGGVSSTKLGTLNLTFRYNKINIGPIKNPVALVNYNNYTFAYLRVNWLLISTGATCIVNFYYNGGIADTAVYVKGQGTTDGNYEYFKSSYLVTEISKITVTLADTSN